MNALTERLTACLKPGMRVPDEIVRLHEWTIANGEVHEVEGDLIGDLGVGSATEIALRTYDNELLHFWFDDEDAAVLDRLCVFAGTGGEGSMAAFWLDDDGRQHIVHMGSGSGSTAVCLLGAEPVDFLRLAAIGYDELCWSRMWDAPPPTVDEEGVARDLDTPFRRWVIDEFGVTVPDRALDVVATPAHMEDDDPRDPFAAWLAGLRN